LYDIYFYLSITVSIILQILGGYNYCSLKQLTFIRIIQKDSIIYDLVAIITVGVFTVIINTCSKHIYRISHYICCSGSAVRIRCYLHQKVEHMYMFQEATFNV